MPTEYFFDQLDLREEPPRSGGVVAEFITTNGITCDTMRCGTTSDCSKGCCTI